MNFDWKNIVKNVAPMLGTALGGPIAGAATKFIADKLLGNPNASQDEIAQALSQASPETMLKLKELDTQFAIEMGRQGIDMYALQVQDRSSAREREIAVKDKTPSLLAFTTLILTVGLVVFFSYHGFDETEKSIIFMMIQLCTAFFMYYYGDSNRKGK